MKGIQLEERLRGSIQYRRMYISDGFPYFEVIVRSLVVEVVFIKSCRRAVVTCRITRTGANANINDAQ